MFIAALFIIDPNGKHPRCLSVGEWVTSHAIFVNGILLNNKKELKQTWMNLKNNMLNKRNLIQKSS